MLAGIPQKLCATIVLLPLSLCFSKNYETATIESYEHDRGLRIEGHKVDPANKFALGAEDVKDGAKRLNLNYRLASPESEVLVVRPFKVRSRVYRLSIQVFGDGKGAQIGFLFRANNGILVRSPLGMVTFKGWKTLQTRYVSPGSAAASTPYRNDDNRATWMFRMPRMHYPFVLEGIYLRSPRPIEGALAFDNLSIMGRFQLEHLVDVKLRPKNGTPYFWGQDKPAMAFEFSTPGTVAVKANLQVILKDSREKVISTIINEPVAVESGKVTTTPIPIDVASYGAYYLQCRLGMASSRKSFCWLPGKASVSPAGRLGVTVDDPGIGEDIPFYLEAAKSMGASRVRFRFMWNQIEGSPGEYSFPKRYDLAIESCLRLGLQPLVVIGDLNPHYESGRFPQSDEAVKAFSNFGLAMARHYKGKVRHWEVFNATNSSRFNLQSAKPYMKLLERLYPLMKAEDPDSVIVGGSIYGIQFSYIEDMMGTYLGDGMDAFSVQPTHYGSSDFHLEYYFQSYLSRLGRNLKAYGAGDLNVWLTSIWNNRAVRRSNSGGGSSWNHFGDRNAASKFCRMALASAPYDFCEGVYIHSLTDGVVSQRSYVNALIDPDGSPTAGYAAFNTVARMIGNKRFVNNLPIEVSNKGGRGNNYPPFAHLYSNDNGKLLAAWTRGGYFTYNFKTDAEQLILTDLMGNESTVKTWNGLLSLRLSNEPTFIKGFSEIEIGPPIFSLTAPESSPAGLPVEMELTVAEGFPNEGFELELPNGWQSEWTSATDLKLALPERVSLGNHSVTLKPKNFPGMSSSTNVSLHESTVLKLSAAEDGTLKVTVTNPLPIVRKANVQVSLYAPEVSKELLSEEFTVPAEDSIVKQFQAGAEHPEGYSQARIMARLNTGRGSGKREVFYLGNTPCYEMSKVELDGSLVEWQGLRPALLDQKYQYNEERSPDRKSAEDLSARFWTGWDSEQFYVAVEVVDETHRNSYSGNYLCYGDSIRFTVAGDQLASDFGVAKLGSGMINTHEFYPSSNNGPDDLKAKIVRTGTKTFYEVAVTWPRLRVPYEHRDLLRFSLLLIDADVRKVEGVMEWCNWPGWSSSMRAEHHNPMIWLKGN